MKLNSEVKLSLVNLLGAVVMSDEVRVSQEVEKYAFDISKVESGVYYVIAESADSREVRKVVVTK